MRRLLLNVAASISFILCIAICAVWVRSFYLTDQRTLLRPAATYQVMSHAGVLVVQQIRPGDGEVRWMRGKVVWSALGMEVIEGRLNRRRPWRLLLLPYWVPAAVAFILPGVWLASRAKRQRTTRVCPLCGDELPAGAICAKCATMAKPPPPPPTANPEPPPPSLNPRPVAYRRAV